MVSDLTIISDFIKHATSDGGDMYDAIKEFKNIAEPSSISKKSKNGIFEFPFLVSSNLSNNTKNIAIIIKMLEIDFSDMILVAIGLNPSINDETNAQIQRTISNYHQNESTELYNMDYETDCLDVAFKHRINKKFITTEAVHIYSNVKNRKEFFDALNQFKNDNNIDKNDFWIDQGDVIKGQNGIMVTSDLNIQYADDFDEFMKTYSPQSNNSNSSNNTNNPNNPPPTDPTKPTICTSINDGGGSSKNNTPNDPEFFQICAERTRSDYQQMFNNTIIKVHLRMGTNQSSDFSLHIGVKGTCHYIPMDELAYVMKSFLKERTETLMTRYIRWRTGEIKSLRDLLLRYDDIKRDVEFDKRVGTNNSWLKVLRARGNSRKTHSIFNSIQRLLGSDYDDIKATEILPNCSFILTLEDIDLVERETGVNIFKNSRSAKKFLDDAMGLSLVIYDEVHGVCHILYSGYDKYMIYPLSELKSKSKNDDSVEVLLQHMLKRM